MSVQLKETQTCNFQHMKLGDATVILIALYYTGIAVDGGIHKLSIIRSQEIYMTEPWCVNQQHTIRTAAVLQP